MSTGTRTQWYIYSLLKKKKKGTLEITYCILLFQSTCYGLCLHTRKKCTFKLEAKNVIFHCVQFGLQQCQSCGNLSETVQVLSACFVWRKCIPLAFICAFIMERIIQSLEGGWQLGKVFLEASEPSRRLIMLFFCQFPLLSQVIIPSGNRGQDHISLLTS
jgi:hypothetical protein